MITQFDENNVPKTPFLSYFLHGTVSLESFPTQEWQLYPFVLWENFSPSFTLFLNQWTNNHHRKVEDLWGRDERSRYFDCPLINSSTLFFLRSKKLSQPEIIRRRKEETMEAVLFLIYTWKIPSDLLSKNCISLFLFDSRSSSSFDVR